MSDSDNRSDALGIQTTQLDNTSTATGLTGLLASTSGIPGTSGTESSRSPNNSPDPNPDYFESLDADTKKKLTSIRKNIAKTQGITLADNVHKADKRLDHLNSFRSRFLNKFQVKLNSQGFPGSDCLPISIVDDMVTEAANTIKDKCLTIIDNVRQTTEAAQQPHENHLSDAFIANWKTKRLDVNVLDSSSFKKAFELESKQAYDARILANIEELTSMETSSSSQPKKRPLNNQGSNSNYQGTHNTNFPSSLFNSSHSFDYRRRNPRQQPLILWQRKLRTQILASPFPPRNTRRKAVFLFKQKEGRLHEQNLLTNNIIYINKLSKTTPPSTYITNDGVYNITNLLTTTTSPRILTDREVKLLSLGLKHIFTPCDRTNQEYLTDFDKFARSIRIQYQFFNSPSDRGAKIYWIPQPSFQPNKASPLIEKYIRQARSKFLNSLILNKAGFTHPLMGDETYYDTIKSLKSDISIIILKADKSAGIVIANREWYINEVYKLLSNTANYVRVLPVDLPKNDHFYSTLETILVKYDQLYTHIKPNQLTRLANYILQLNDSSLFRYPTFYGLVKMHKLPICLRPILSCINSPTYHASKWVDWKLKSIMFKGFSFVKDSKQLLLQLQNTIHLSADSTLLSADVVSLYPSIDLADAYIKIRLYLLNTTLNIKDIDLIMDLLVWIMENNYCKFSDTYYRQLRGAAMGQPCAVVFAVIYLFQLEKELLDSIPKHNHPLLFKRFIDDIIAIFKCTTDANNFITAYNKLHASITLTFDIDTTVTIMDITISIKDSPSPPSSLQSPTKQLYLHTILFQKPTNKYLYLTPHSFHHPSIFFNFINSELKRYRLYCSDDNDYETVKQAFRERLLARGYTTNYLHYIFVIPYIRAELLAALELTYKINPTTPPESPLEALIFPTVSTPRTDRLNINKCLQTPEYVLSSIEGATIFNRIIICKRTTSNLEQLLTSSSLSTPVAVDFDRLHDLL
jgi:hypothetical protein